MIYSIKLSSFAWSLHDGARMKNGVGCLGFLPSSFATDFLSFLKEKLPKRFEEHVVADMPSLLEYYAYLFFPGGFLVGPSIHYSVFDKYMQLKVYESLFNQRKHPLMSLFCRSEYHLNPNPVQKMADSPLIT